MTDHYEGPKLYNFWFTAEEARYIVECLKLSGGSVEWGLAEDILEDLSE